MTILVIHGDPTGEAFRKVQRIVGMTRLYRQGTDKELYARYLRKQDAEAAMAKINEIDDVWATAYIENT